MPCLVSPDECFVPDSSPFFTNIDNRLNNAKPITVVRKAFPNMFPSEKIALPGTTSASYNRRSLR